MPAAAWVVSRRYSEFHDLNKRLRSKFPQVRNLEFPRRQMMLKLQKDFLQKRRIGLEKYLRVMILHRLLLFMLTFLGPASHPSRLPQSGVSRLPFPSCHLCHRPLGEPASLQRLCLSHLQLCC